MVYHVLVIGYMQEEQAILSKQYNKDNIELEFAYSAENAEQLIDSHSYAWTIFHSRTLNCMVYIDIMRKIKDIPILILTSACIECGQEVIQNMLKVEGDTLKGVEQHTFVYGNLYFCQEQRMVRVCEREIHFTKKEFDLFALLISNPNRVFTYEMIMDIVWNEVYDSYSRKTIINHISNIRKKLNISPEVPNYIKSIHSIGYKFEVMQSKK